MGLGRQVADAYIAVHGDLSDFRKDLDKAGGYAAEQAAINNADKFSKAWGDRVTEDVNNRWAKIVDAMYSDKALDWDKLVGTFDPHGNLDEAERKIKAFTEDMAAAGKINAEEQEQFNKALGSTLDGMREQNRLLDERAAKMQELSKAETDAAAENERWARTFDGLRSNDALAKMNKDFEKLATARNDADMGRFISGFDGFDAARARIVEVTDAMREQGRVSKEDQLAIIDQFHRHIQTQEDLLRVTEETKAATERARLEQERYNRSLDGMIKAAEVQALSDKFRDLASAMASGDWSKITKGSKDLAAVRQSVIDSTLEMRRLGTITDNEFLRINKAFATAHQGSEALHQSLSGKLMGSMLATAGQSKILQNGFENFGGILGKLLPLTKGLQEHLGGFVGLNVFKDMAESGLNFIHNLDGISLSVAQLTLKFGTMAAIGGSSIAGLSVIIADMANALGGVSLLAPAFATGLGLMIYTTGTALASLKKKFKATFGEIKKDMGDAMFTAMDPAMDRFENVLLPTLKKELKGLAASMGLLYGAIFDGIVDVVSPEKMSLMFKRLDDAVLKSRAGVKSLVNVWATLGEVGTRYYDRLAVAFNTASAALDRFISEAANNGDLEKWIERGLTGFKDMGRALDGVFGIFNAVTDAARKAGAGGLTDFADKLQTIARVMQAPMFQGALTTFFEGAEIAVTKIGTALGNLGPAIASIMPAVKIALSDIGSTIGTLIDYIAQIFQSPVIQTALTGFTGSIKTAMDALGPAVKPFTDSLAHAMDLLGQILVNVAEIGASLTVHVSPVLDAMSTQLATLMDPLKNSALKVIEALTPVLSTLNTEFVTPVIAAIRDHLIPAFDGFVKQFAPFADKVIKDLSPALIPLVETVLPNLISLIGELLPVLGKMVDLFSPLLVTTVTNLGTALKNMADSVKVLKGELPITELFIFKAFDPAQIKSDADASRAEVAKQMSGKGDTVSWGQIISDVFWGAPPDVFWSRVYAKIGPSEAGAKKWDDSVGKWLEGARSGIVDLFNAQPENIDKLEKQVNDWFNSSVFDPIRKGWDEAMKGIDEWWTEVKKGFQTWMNGLLGFGEHDSSLTPATVTGGGGAGAKGGGIGAKILPQILDAEGEKTWLEQFNTDVNTNLKNFWDGLGANLTAFGAGVATNWDAFWGGLGTKVSEVWNGITTWISTKAGEISTNITTFAGEVKTNWDAFWNGVNAKVNEIWTAVTTWISGKVGEIRAGIDGFIGQVRTNWDNFWAGVNQTVTNTWNTITGWIGQKVGEIQGNIDRFIGQVTGAWNGFWGGLPGFVSEAWSNIVSGVQSGVGQVISFVGSLPGQILGALGNLGSLLLGAGSSIMSGLRQGLEGAWGGVQEFVGGIASWIAEHKGPISYDRVLLVPAGQAIMQGLAGGLQSQLGMLKGVLATVTATMSDAITENLAASKMYIAGADAALGLAQGLSDNKSTVLDAFATLTPDASANPTLTAVGGTGAGTVSGGKTTIVNVQAGAMPVTTPTQDPALVAAKVIDGFASLSNV